MSSFSTQGAARGGEAAPRIGVGMLGYAFMGKAHTNAYRKLSYMTWPPPLEPRLVSIAGRDETAVSGAARRYGFEKFVTDWHELVADPDVALFDNAGPNGLHAEPCIAAARAGKHVICEKPLGRTADESYEMWSVARIAGIKHMCGFNYRFVPAVRLARQMLEAGELGEIYHFRARYLQEWIMDPQFEKVWRLDAAQAGSGALGDLGAHVFDLARFLVGEVEAVSATTRTFVPERPGGSVDVDDAFEAVVEFEDGVVGTVEASRFCLGRKNSFQWEVNGARGSLCFDLERLNELWIGDAGGFRQRLVTEASDPFIEWWWPHGHIVGWEHTFVHELHQLLTAIRDDSEVRPYGADFEDGYRTAEICDAVLRSARSGRREQITYLA